MGITTPYCTDKLSIPMKIHHKWQDGIFFFPSCLLSSHSTFVAFITHSMCGSYFLGEKCFVDNDKL